MADEESSSVTSHLSVAMTTTHLDEAQTTSVNIMTSPLSRGVDFYFKCAVVVIGAIGTAANALILYAMVASGQHKKHLLIFNQNVLDLCSCLFLVILYPLHLSNIYLSGTLGYWLCIVLFSDILVYCPVIGSIVNLASITVERYLRIVHPIWSKKWLRNRVIYSAMAIAWISGFVYNVVIVFMTTAVVDGVCYGYAIWESQVSRAAVSIYSFVTFYVVILLIFIIGYWRILAAIRRQANAMAAHGPSGSSSATQAQLNQTRYCVS